MYKESLVCQVRERQDEGASGKAVGHFELEPKGKADKTRVGKGSERSVRQEIYDHGK